MPREIKNCNICSSSNFSVDTKATFYLNLPKPYEVTRCKACDFRWLNPQPTESEYSEIYSAAYFNSDEEGASTHLSNLFPATEDNYSTMIHIREVWYAEKLKRVRKLSC